jgi:phosphoglycolate phosphatase-like HAD superfamily hydrolase
VRLRKEGLRLAVASSSKKEMLKRLLSLVEAEDLLEAKTSSDDAENSKPDPDIVHAALRRLGEDPDRAVMVGDTPYDIEAAARAGLRSIALRCGGWKDADLRGAVEIYDGPAELLEQLDQSVLVAAAVR